MNAETTNTHAQEVAANVKALTSDGEMLGVRIFEFDNKGFLVSLTQAPRAHFGEDGAWMLEQAERSEFGVQADAARVRELVLERASA